MLSYQRILIANRGEIAVRVERTCRILGIDSIALFTAEDRNSLHVRLADEAIQVAAADVFYDGDAILKIALAVKADAIHPGYGFLAERAEFIYACHAAGIGFIGSPAEIVEAVGDKISVLARAEAAGFPVIRHSRACFEDTAIEEMCAEADLLGFPIVVKSCQGGRGRGERLVLRSEQFRQAVSRSQAEAQAVYGTRAIYLEKAILPANQISVQILGDHYGQRVHLGEREGSIILGNQKLFEEAPAACLSAVQRQELLAMSLELADLFNLQNVSTLEFLVDEGGQIFFTEIKPRISVEHPLNEGLARLDLVAEQIRLAAGEPLGYRQEDIELRGWTMECRVTAEDPWMSFMPSPGQLRMVRLPSGPDVRIDTYVYQGCEISSEFDSLIAKLTVWAGDRQSCLRKMQQALDEFKLTGPSTNLPILQRLMTHPLILDGSYNTNLRMGSLGPNESEAQPGFSANPEDPTVFRDLAIAAAIHYLRRSQSISSGQPERLHSGWHRKSRQLPE